MEGYYRALAEGNKDNYRMIQYHGDARRFIESHGDQVHANSIWIIGLHKAGALTPDDVNEFVGEIMFLTNNDGSVSRHRLDLGLCSRDQYMPLIQALKICGALGLRDRIYNYCIRERIFWQPHHVAYAMRCADIDVSWWRRALEEAFEFFDILSDKLNDLVLPIWPSRKLNNTQNKSPYWISGRNGVDSSVVKNIVRRAALDKRSILFFSASEVMRRYFAHSHSMWYWNDPIDKPPYFIAEPWEVWFNASR